MALTHPTGSRGFGFRRKLLVETLGLSARVIPNPLVRRSASCPHGFDSQGCPRCRLPVMPELGDAIAA